MTKGTVVFSDRRVVVGVDTTPSSDRALRWAFDEARRLGADLDVVHAWQPDVVATAEGIPVEGDPAEAEARAKLRLHAVMEDAAFGREALAPKVRPRLVRAKPVAALVAESATADEVVMGVDAHGPLERALLGAVNSATIRRSRCTVTIVPDVAPSPDAPVVVGVDGSDASFAALAWGYDLAAAQRLPLVVVKAIMPVLGLDGSLEGNALCQRDRTMIIDRVDELAQSRELRPRAVKPHVCIAWPSRTLVRAAAGASHLVVGFDGETRTGRLGVVARRVAHRAARPVTIVK